MVSNNVFTDIVKILRAKCVYNPKDYKFLKTYYPSSKGHTPLNCVNKHRIINLKNTKKALEENELNENNKKYSIIV